MDDSILISIKELIGYGKDDTPFDSDFLVFINTVFGVITQLGVGPKEGFSISDQTTTWGEFTQSLPLLALVKTYIQIRVKLLFDTTSLNSTTRELLTEQYKELEWRMVTMTQTTEEENEND